MMSMSSGDPDRKKRRRNTEIKKVESRSARYVCFSKRRDGLFKKAQAFHRVSGSHVAVLVFSPTGKPYVHGSPSFESVVDTFLTKTTATPTTSCSIISEQEEESPPPPPPAASSFDVGSMRQWVDSINVEECQSLEELMEMKNKVEEAKVIVGNKIVEELMLLD